MAAAGITRKCHYIAKEDLKPKYQETRNGIARIEAFTRAIEVAAEKIGAGCHVTLQVENKEGGTIQFTITADSRIRANNVAQYIQGEFCDVSAQAKYDADDLYLPSRRIKGIEGAREAQRELSKPNQRLLQGEDHPVLLTEEALRKHDIKHMTGPCELRQFGCAPCDHFWWRIVPVSKMVSRCRECQIRYDALPRKKEFGIGRFQCTKPACKRVFFAKCVATDSLRCRKCKTSVKNPHIHPRWRKPRHLPRSRRRGRPRQGHSLNPSAAPFVPGSQQRREPSFEPVSALQGRMNQASHSGRPTSAGYLYQPSAMSQSSQLSQAGIPPQATGRAAPPPNKPRVKNASRVHNPSGSTVSTFITQMDEADFDEVPLDYDSDNPDEGVGACRFECDCGNRYTVLCEMTDTARCYECGCNNEPMGWAPPRNIDAETSNPHSCSKCQGQPGCPNLLAVADIIYY